MTPGDLSALIGPLRLASPLLTAAGTVGYGVEFAPILRRAPLGALVTKTITAQPRSGHQPPRLVETPAGMLNCVGLQNVGLEAFATAKWPALREALPVVPVIISLLGETLEEWTVLTQRLAALEGVSALELNLSCPNLEHGALGARRPALLAHDPDATQRVVAHVRQHTTLPLLAKLAPDVADITPIVEAAAVGGATAVVIGNTYRAMAIDPRTRRSKLSQPTGGLSGPAIRPITLRHVWEAARLRRLPVVAAGGVVSADDALEYLLAGACAVEVGTGHFARPDLLRPIAAGLTAYLRRAKMAHIHELIGTLTC